MNDTTRWIMIILLLLLIAAAVFMLLRSPGKDDGDAVAGRTGAPPEAVDDTPGRGGSGATAVPRADTDEPVREPVESATYEDTTTAPVESPAYEDTTTAPVESRAHDDTTTTPAAASPYGDTAAPAAASPYGDTATPADSAPAYETTEVDGGDRVDETAEPYRPAASALDDDRDHRSAQDQERDGVAESTTDVHPLTDDEITEGGRDEPLTGQDQEPGAAPDGESSDVDRHDAGAAAAAAAAGAGGGGATAVTAPSQDRQDDLGHHQDTLYGDHTADRDAGAGGRGLADQDRVDRDDDRDGSPEFPVGAESTTYRAADGDAVVVDRDRSGDTLASETDTASAGWDAPPADSGTGAPQTADEIVDGRATADDTSQTDRTDQAEGADRTDQAEGADRTDQAEGADRTDQVGRADEADQAGYAPIHTEAAYGPGSAEPLEDGSGPAGWEVKGNIGSMLFHTTESPSYDAVRAEVWFESEDAARAAGFAHWDRRRR